MTGWLWSWQWRPGVLLVLLALGAAYGVGWWRLRRRGHWRLARGWRLLVYSAGLGSVAVALCSPLEPLAELLLTAHMIQHQILLMIAPPLLLLGNPFPLVLWGLPRGVRRAIAGSLTRRRPARAAQRLLTRLPVAGLLYTLNLWAWHLPTAYEAALGHPVVHDLEHVLFFATAVLFWWPVVDPAPRLSAPRGGLYYGLRIAYLILATAQNTLLGALIGLTERVLYASYAAAPRIFGWTALDDQAFAGGVMWSGSHMYLVAILILLSRALDAGERTEPVPALPGGRARR